MQISRHWRLNAQRYRLQGVRYTNGDVRLVAKAYIDELAKSTTSSAEGQRPSTLERVPLSTR